MSSQKIEKVALKDLKISLFVRKQLNQEHALYLAELIENGTQLPPIQITSDYVVIDGRHRIEAHGLNNQNEIMAEIVDNIVTDSELISMAYRANIGGPLPPSQHDTEYTVMLLLDRGENIKRIACMLGLPINLARKYINSVQSKVLRKKLIKAIRGITEDGITIDTAADKYGVNADSIKQMISGQNRKCNSDFFSDVMKGLNVTYKSVNLKKAALFKELMQKYDDSDVTDEQVEEVFARIEKLHNRSAHLVNEWKRRFEAKGKIARL